MTIEPGTIPTKDFHQFMLGAVSPRPIAFASTISPEGVPNLAPYSFFNAFSSNPPILIFSSNRRVSNNTTKDTLHNIEQTKEVVINVVPHRIVRQMALCSIEYGPEIDEFKKSGLTPLPSERIKPFRVAESPVQMECVVEQILPLGDQGGAGNLIVCRVVLMHIDDAVLTDKGRIDPHKIDLMGRMGRFYYARASGPAVCEIVQEVTKLGIGFDALPETIRHSTVLTGNQLAQLAALPALPGAEEARDFAQQDTRFSVFLNGQNGSEALHLLIQSLIEQGEIEAAANAAVLG